MMQLGSVSRGTAVAVAVKAKARVATAAKRMMMDIWRGEGKGALDVDFRRGDRSEESQSRAAHFYTQTGSNETHY